MKSIYELLGQIVLVTLSILLSGYVLTHLWAWFIIPIWPALPALSIKMAIGLSLTVSYLTHQRKTKTDDEDIGSRILMTVVLNLAIWGIGAIVHAF